jgi:hypothetical protein
MVLGSMRTGYIPTGVFVEFVIRLITVRTDIESSMTKMSEIADMLFRFFLRG